VKGTGVFDYTSAALLAEKDLPLINIVVPRLFADNFIRISQELINKRYNVKSTINFSQIKLRCASLLEDALAM
jgi:hypothetical protein